VQATSPSADVVLRGSIAPGPAVAERRASDVLPPAAHARGASAWTLALLTSVARTTWVAVTLTLVFLASAVVATWASGRSVTAALPWTLIGAGLWLVITLTWTLIRRR
jgi:hypothetical protein